jgi:hypothetical protein
VHLLCRDTECVGNDLPAGLVDDETCRYCGRPLADESGHGLAQGAAPLIGGAPPESFDALMDALRDAGQDVRLVELSAVRVGDKLLLSAVDDDGELVQAEVIEGPQAAEVEHLMGLLDERSD